MVGSNIIAITCTGVVWGFLALVSPQVRRGTAELWCKIKDFARRTWNMTWEERAAALAICMEENSLDRGYTSSTTYHTSYNAYGAPIYTSYTTRQPIPNYRPMIDHVRADARARGLTWESGVGFR